MSASHVKQEGTRGSTHDEDLVPNVEGGGGGATGRSHLAAEKEARKRTGQAKKKRYDLPIRLIKQLLSDPALHVPAPSKEGYRNKALYGLDTCETSILVNPTVNGACKVVF
ncbi:hypothetical protein GUITHDRAFT_151357, partial [Guillardia theta CCMP2712]